MRTPPGVRRDAGGAEPRADRDALQARLLRDFEASGGGWFWSTDASGRLDYISEHAALQLGATAADLIGRPLLALLVCEGTPANENERTLPLALNAHMTFSDVEVRAAVDDDHQEIWWSISGRPQQGACGAFTGYFGNGADISEKRSMREDASRLAMFDTLTGLPNRNRMLQLLGSTLNISTLQKRSCAVMVIDVDRFKVVNDTLGQSVGDSLLKQIAERMQSVVDSPCLIGRSGGDEFQIILPDIDDRGRLGDIGRQIITMVSQPYSIDGRRCVIGASMGIAIAPYDGVASDELLRNASLALYAAKSGGRGQFRLYANDLHREAEQRRRIEEDLRDALSKDQIYLTYQPLVDARTNRVVAFEALMRWEHPELGGISPGVFIPIAEESRLIGALGSWALKQACADAAEWRGAAKVSVNVSPVQFADESLPLIVAQALASSGLPPERLELELTESIFLEGSGSSSEMFASLKKIGVRLALDDFGTGYSSLGYLRTTPFDKIKIDQTFIRGVTEPDCANAAIIKAIVSLAEALGMDTTAEGIEAQDELALMRDLGVGQIQGYIYSRPVRAEQALAAMDSGEWVIEPNGPRKHRAVRRTVLRKVGVIHDDHRYEVTMRNLSRSGCLIEGLLDVPAGTEFVVDLGEGQLAVATVRRSADAQQGLQFEVPLVDDGAGGLVTRNRISPYALAAAGMPLTALAAGVYPLLPAPAALGFNLPRFGQHSEAVRKAFGAAGR